MKPEPQVFFRPYLEYIKLDWAEALSPNYISLVYSTVHPIFALAHRLDYNKLIRAQSL
jgi:hypothetical protein